MKTVIFCLSLIVTQSCILTANLDDAKNDIIEALNNKYTTCEDRLDSLTESIAICTEALNRIEETLTNMEETHENL